MRLELNGLSRISSKIGIPTAEGGVYQWTGALVRSSPAGALVHDRIWTTSHSNDLDFLLMISAASMVDLRTSDFGPSYLTYAHAYQGQLSKPSKPTKD